MNKLLSIFGMTIPLTARFNRPADDAGGETPAEKSPESKGGAAADEVKLSRKDYDDLIALKTKVPELTSQLEGATKVRTAMHRIIKGEGTPAEKSAAMTELLSDAGYTAEQIAEYMKTNAPSSRGNGKGRGRRQEVEDDEDEEDEADPRDQEIAELKAQTQQLSQAQKETRLRELRSILGTQTTAVLTGKNTALGKVMAALTANSEGLEGAELEGIDYTRAQIREELERKTIERVNLRRQKHGGNVDENWFAEEAAKAGEEVARKYRPLVIGLPSRIGRSPDTEDGTEQLLTSEPVKAPKYEKGLNTETAKASLTNWAADMLGREAAKESRNGKSVTAV